MVIYSVASYNCVLILLRGCFVILYVDSPVA